MNKLDLKLMFLRVHMHYLTFASLDGTIEYSAELFNLKTPELLFPNLSFDSPNNSKNPNNSVMNLFQTIICPILGAGF